MTGQTPDRDEDELEIELSDEDVLDAMKQIQGYIDVSVNDFRVIYHLAHQHAIQRLTAGLEAASLMRRGIPSLSPDQTLETAAKVIASSGYKGLPVVDEAGIVAGMLTETDFLRHVGADSFLGLLLNLMDDTYLFSHRCHEIRVGEAMTSPAVCVPLDASFGEIYHAFRAHKGRSQPVIDASGRLMGLILRKDFLTAAHLEKLI
jgi:CBS domain-containing membrane protein